MRNISAWAIRNPVIPLVLFAALLAWAWSLHADGRQDQSRTSSSPVVDRSRSASRAPRRPSSRSRSPSGSRRRCARSTASTRSTRAIREGNTQTVVQFEIGTPIDRAVTDVRDAIARIRGDLPDGILEPQVERERFHRRADRLFLGGEHVDDARAAELVSSTTRSTARAAGASPASPRSAAPAASAARSGSMLDPARMQAQGVTATPDQPAAARDEPERGRRPRRDRRLRAVGARPRQRAHRLRSSARPRSRSAAAARSGSLDVASVRDQWAEQSSYGIQNGRQVVSFMIQKAKGYSDVTVYHARRRKSCGELGARGSAASASTCSSHPVEYIEMQYRIGDAGAGRRRAARGPRRLPVPARLARDADLGDRHPAVGDPGLLVHGPAGLHAQHGHPARAEPGGGRARRRRDRRDREYRPPHANGQVRLSGVDRRRRRDRPAGGRDHLLDRRRVPARVD